MPKRSAAEANSEQPDWNTFTVPALKNALGLRGLPKTGKKAELVACLDGYVLAQSNEALDMGPGGATSTARAPKSKKAKTRGPEPILDGPLASNVIEHQHLNPETGERRLREFVPAPDVKFKDKIKRINKERMFMLDRKVINDGNGHPEEETFTIAGSTGNIYTCSIGKIPRCNCMDALMRGQKCKHINYALIIILKAPLYLQYQLAFLSEELEQIFANAPVTRAPDLAPEEAMEPSTREVVRKPIDGECPICVFDMEPDEDIVWCKAACGQNFHEDCFEQWRRSKMGGRVTCVYCRTKWQDEGAQPTSAWERLQESAPKIGSYKNIGHLSMYQKTGEPAGED